MSEAKFCITSALTEVGEADLDGTRCNRVKSVNACYIRLTKGKTEPKCNGFCEAKIGEESAEGFISSMKYIMALLLIR